jgi:hypothetical protein
MVWGQSGIIEVEEFEQISEAWQGEWFCKDVGGV